MKLRLNQSPFQCKELGVNFRRCRSSSILQAQPYESASCSPPSEAGRAKKVHDCRSLQRKDGSSKQKERSREPTPLRLLHSIRDNPALMVPVHLPSEVLARSLMHAASHFGEVRGYVVFEAVLADVAQQLLHLRNLDHTREMGLGSPISVLYSCERGTRPLRCRPQGGGVTRDSRNNQHLRS